MDSQHPLAARANGWAWRALNESRLRQRAVAYVGIDPGRDGGLAILSRPGRLLGTMALPKMIRPDIPSLIGETAGKGRKQRLAWVTDSPVLRARLAPLLSEFATIRVVVERVWGRPGDTPMTAFSFGMNYAFTLAALDGLGAVIEFVVPTVWKRAVLGDEFSHDKAGAIAWAARSRGRVPLMASPRSREPHEGIADAVCLAEWLARAHWAADRAAIQADEEGPQEPAEAPALPDDDSWLS